MRSLTFFWEEVRDSLHRLLRFMKCLAAILVGCFVAATAFAQSSAISRSGQFIVTGVAPGTPRPFEEGVSGNSKLVKLEPALLTVSSERIKQALLGALGVTDQWRGKIQIALHPAREADADITVAATQFTDSWDYQVEMPDAVAPARFVRVITQVLLVEMANRQSGGAQSAALPAWLAEGMPQYLLGISDVDLLLVPPAASIGNLPSSRREQYEGRRVNPFTRARERLLKREPLTIKQLSFPDPEQLAGLDGETYRDCAMLFINELLQIKSGGAYLAAMLPELGWDPDWRVAFLKAFHPVFSREIDFEKWWLLQSAYFAGRSPSQQWPRADSLAKLNEILRTAIEVRIYSNEPAMHTDVPLQAILRGWEFPRQSQAFHEKINLLVNLQPRVAPELTPLVQQYREVLAVYLDKMEGETSRPQTTPGRHPAAGKTKLTGVPSESNPVVRHTLMELDVLDARAQAWKFNRDKLPGFPESKVQGVRENN